MTGKIENTELRFHRDGFVVLKDFLDRQRLNSWSESFVPFLNHHLKNFGDPSFRGTQRYDVILPFIAPFANARVFDSDFIFQLMEQLAGPDFVTCQLATDTPALFAEAQLETPS